MSVPDFLLYITTCVCKMFYCILQHVCARCFAVFYNMCVQDFLLYITTCVSKMFYCILQYVCARCFTVYYNMCVQDFLLYITTCVYKMFCCVLQQAFPECFLVYCNMLVPDVLTLCSNMSVPSILLCITTRLYQLFLKSLRIWSAYLRLCLRSIGVRKYFATLAQNSFQYKSRTSFRVHMKLNPQRTRQLSQLERCTAQPQEQTSHIIT